MWAQLRTNWKDSVEEINSNPPVKSSGKDVSVGVSSLFYIKNFIFNLFINFLHFFF